MNFYDDAVKVFEKSRVEDLEDALYIVQTERDMWRARAIKLANLLRINNCDIDSSGGEDDKWLDEMVANIKDKKLKLSSVNPEEYAEYIEEVKNERMRGM